MAPGPRSSLPYSLQPAPSPRAYARTEPGRTTCLLLDQGHDGQQRSDDERLATAHLTRPRHGSQLDREVALHPVERVAHLDIRVQRGKPLLHLVGESHERELPGAIAAEIYPHPEVAVPYAVFKLLRDASVKQQVSLLKHRGERTGRWPSRLRAGAVCGR